MFGMRSSMQAAMKRAKQQQKKNAKAEARLAAKAARKEAKKKAKPKPKMKIQSALGTLWEDVAKKLTRLDRSVEDQCLDMRRIQSQIKYFDDTIHSHTEHQLLTKLVWKIGGFKRLLREQATVGGLIYSPKFSSHSGGYSVMCSVCSVEKNGKDYLSLMVCMVRGNYDAHLPWPFAIPIRFSILAQNAQETDTRNPELDITKILDCEKVNTHTEAFERPTETFGKSVVCGAGGPPSDIDKEKLFALEYVVLGVHRFRFFTEKDKVLTDPYLQNDVLFISIGMDKEAVESLRVRDGGRGRTEEGAPVIDLGEVRSLCPVGYSGDKVIYWPDKKDLGHVVPEDIETASDDDVTDELHLKAIQLEERQKSPSTFT